MTPSPDGLSYQPDYSFSPGETLNEVLADQGMSQAELARRTRLSVKHVNQISQGLASITAETSLRLESVTGVPAHVWTSLEADYQVGRSRQEEAARLESNLDWLKMIPVRELANRNYISKDAKGVDQLREILRFFQVAMPAAWEQVWAVPTAYRLSQAFTPEYGALASWLRIGELRASEIQLAAFDRNRFRNLLPKFRELTIEADPRSWLPCLQEECASAGVAIVIEKEIKGARVNGAVRWLPSGHPLILLSLRHRWADIFWFTFFHEAGHLLIHDRRRLTIIDGASSSAQAVGNQQINQLMEAEADDFSSKVLIPKEHEHHLARLATPEQIQSFAHSINIHPGIVVGRLQHDRRIPYNQMNDLRVLFSFSDDPAK